MSTDVHRTKRALLKRYRIKKRKAKQVPEIRCTGSEIWCVQDILWSKKQGPDIIAELKAIMLNIRRCIEMWLKTWGTLVSEVDCMMQFVFVWLLLFDRFCWKNERPNWLVWISAPRQITGRAHGVSHQRGLFVITEVGYGEGAASVRLNLCSCSESHKRSLKCIFMKRR